MVEQLFLTPAKIRELRAQLSSQETNETRQAAVVAALGGPTTPRAKEYRELLDRLNAAITRK